MQDQHLLDDLYCFIYISFINRSAVYQISISLKADKIILIDLKKLAAAPHVYQETKLMENIHKIILALSIIFMYPMLRPPVHILRNRKLMLYVFSILLPSFLLQREISICLK
jgi:hypothetical protein